MMLDNAHQTQRAWKTKFELARKRDDRTTVKDAARNHKALDGVIKTLQWVLGEDGKLTTL